MKQKNFIFPDVEKINNEIVAVGGDLSPDRILQAYRSGIFPWFEEDSCVLWWAPKKRMVIKPKDIKISTSLLRALKKRNYSIKIERQLLFFLSFHRMQIDTNKLTVYQNL